MVVDVADHRDRALLDTEQAGRDFAERALSERVVECASRQFDAPDAHDVAFLDTEGSRDRRRFDSIARRDEHVLPSARCRARLVRIGRATGKRCRHHERERQRPLLHRLEPDAVHRRRLAPFDVVFAGFLVECECGEKDSRRQHRGGLRPEHRFVVRKCRRRGRQGQSTHYEYVFHQLPQSSGSTHRRVPARQISSDEGWTADRGVGEQVSEDRVEAPRDRTATPTTGWLAESFRSRLEAPAERALLYESTGGGSRCRATRSARGHRARFQAPRRDDRRVGAARSGCARRPVHGARGRPHARAAAPALTRTPETER